MSLSPPNGAGRPPLAQAFLPIAWRWS